jgi:hypothetical protein
LFSCKLLLYSENDRPHWLLITSLQLAVETRDHVAIPQ